eukprot:CAMPEP_0170623540 /NCGR_PEP_ID=MMETSP0224-20130122/29754_1 /TAXON_ID=285029 /ORGANISM="Togula jolla, Strain CCCM 725" /LENGTH=59 /DNA_ID=CAMNT_0010950003 /DNA_START=95 /DNA_END=272 /DNA_ORIENTATION=+
MFEWAHRAGIDVEIRIDLYGSNSESMRTEDDADDEIAVPFPKPEMVPPVTTRYFVWPLA